MNFSTSFIIALAAFSPIAFNLSEDASRITSQSSVSSVKMDDSASSAAVKSHVTPGTPAALTLTAVTSMYATFHLNHRGAFHEKANVGDSEGLDTQAFDY